MNKALFTFLIIFLFTSGSVYAQGNSQSPTEPPARVKVNFNARYPNHAGSPKWEQNTNGYTARFKQNGQATECRFTPEGQWIKTSTVVPENKLPANAQKYLKENHPDYTYQKGVKNESKKGSGYEVDIRSENKDYRVLFDEKGGFTDKIDL